MPLLKGGRIGARARAVSASVGGVPALRQGQGNTSPRPAPRLGQGRDQSQPVQLYDLSNDLGRNENLAAAQPGEGSPGMQALLRAV